MKTALLAALTATAALSSAALADPILDEDEVVTNSRGIITADNHYALYVGTDNSLTFIGRNEVGPGGSPGTYNWSQAETWTWVTNPGQYVYIAAWSDDAVAQGLLAQISVNAETFNSGDPRWQVYKTFNNLNDNSPAPTTADMQANIATANAGNLWQTPFVGGNNGVGPWGTIAGINNNIPWMWADNDSNNPLVGGSSEAEYLIFRIAVPTPGTAAMAGLGGLMFARRHRR